VQYFSVVVVTTVCSKPSICRAFIVCLSVHRTSKSRYTWIFQTNDNKSTQKFKNSSFKFLMVKWINRSFSRDSICIVLHNCLCYTLQDLIHYLHSIQNSYANIPTINQRPQRKYATNGIKTSQRFSHHWIGYDQQQKLFR